METGPHGSQEPSDHQGSQDPPDCQVCCETTKNDKCPQCFQIFCLDCTYKYDKAILETEDSSKYPKCINCDFIHTHTIIHPKLRDSLSKKISETIRSEETRVRIEKEKQIELRIAEIEADKQKLLKGLPKSLGLLGQKYIKTDVKKKMSVEIIKDSKVEFVKMCPLDFCDGMIILSNYSCSKCDLKICDKCEEKCEANGVVGFSSVTSGRAAAGTADTTSAHKCDPQVVEDIKYLLMNSTPCPNCKIRINKSDGCDHMWCPNCKSHFSYTTGKINYYGYQQPEERIQAEKKYEYTLKPQKTLTEEETSFLVWGSKLTNISTFVDKLQYEFAKNNITKELYEKNISIAFEKDYISKLNREWFLKSREYIYGNAGDHKVASESTPKGVIDSLKSWILHINSKYSYLKLRDIPGKNK